MSFYWKKYIKSFQYHYNHRFVRTCHLVILVIGNFIQKIKFLKAKFGSQWESNTPKFLTIIKVAPIDKIWFK